MKLALATIAFAASATAFAPATPFGTRVVKSGALFIELGDYDDKLWDNDSKKDVYNRWDPNSPRSTKNFNPFETFGGNSPDASGIFPGESFYKDPKRGDVSFQQMMDERAEAEQRAAMPKPGDVQGAPGRHEKN